MDINNTYKRIDEIAKRCDEIREQAPKLVSELEEALQSGNNAKAFMIQMTMAAQMAEADLMLEEVNTMRREFGI